MDKQISFERYVTIPIAMRKLLLAITIMLFPTLGIAQALEIEGNDLLLGTEKIGNFDVVNDTLKIVKFEKFNVDPFIPEIVLATGKDPKSIHYISESSFMGEGSVRELDVYIPDAKRTPPVKNRMHLNYSVGRHTDQLGIRVKYFKYYGVEAIAGTSIHRSDNQINFMYLGLSNEMNLFYRTGWRGQVSLGPVLLAESGVNEMTITGAGCFSLQKRATDRLTFGPRIMVGGYNEVSMSVVFGL